MPHRPTRLLKCRRLLSPEVLVPARRKDAKRARTLDSSEKTIAILGNRWWPQAAKQEGDKISIKSICTVVYGDDVLSTQLLIEDVSTRSRKGVPSRKGCVVNHQTTSASNK